VVSGSFVCSFEGVGREGMARPCVSVRVMSIFIAHSLLFALVGLFVFPLKVSVLSPPLPFPPSDSPTSS